MPIRPNVVRTWLLLTTLFSPVVQAGVEIAPFVGFRMGGEFDIRDESDDTVSELNINDTRSFGLIINTDLQEAGKQLEFYFGHQDTEASSDNTLLTPGSARIELDVYQLQVGGLYFPGRTTTGGYASGGIGVTRLDPKASGLENHHRVAVSLGGGYKLAVTDNLRLRFDLRGIYTALESGGAIFCSGGCSARVDSSGYLQVEAAAGLAVRF